MSLYVPWPKAQSSKMGGRGRAVDAELIGDNLNSGAAEESLRHLVDLASAQQGR